MARSYDFLFPSVAPVSHVVRMQFKSTNGGTVFIGPRNTIVSHKRDRALEAASIVGFFIQRG